MTIELYEYENVNSFDEAIEICKQFGNVQTDLNLGTVTSHETATVPDQEWHQDGSHVVDFPKYAALWCEEAEEACPATQYISTRLDEDVAKKYIDIETGLDFSKPMNAGKFFIFETKAQERLYRMKAYRGKTPLIQKDEKGYYARWCPFTILPEEINEELSQIFLTREPKEVYWKPKKLAVYANHSTIHRRKPYFNADGHRILRRAYIR